LQYRSIRPCAYRRTGCKPRRRNDLPRSAHHRDYSRNRSERNARHNLLLRRNSLRNFRIFRRFKPHHQPISHSVPTVGIRRLEIEHYARHRRLRLVLVCPDRQNIVLMHRDAIRHWTHSGVRDINDQAWRRCQQLNIRKDLPPAAENLDRRSAALVNDANTPDRRRRPEGLGSRTARADRRENDRHENDAGRSIEPYPRQTTPLNQRF